MSLEKDTCKKYLEKIKGNIFDEKCKKCEGLDKKCEDYRPIGGRGLLEYLSEDDDDWN